MPRDGTAPNPQFAVHAGTQLNQMRDSMKSHPRAWLVLATVILLATSGCFLVAVGAAGAAGAGTVAYVRGELDATLGSSFPAVAYATEKAVSQLQFAPGRETKDALTLEIATRTADDKKLDVIVTSELGKGSVFTVSLPGPKARAAVVADASSPDAGAACGATVQA